MVGPRPVVSSVGEDDDVRACTKDHGGLEGGRPECHAFRGTGPFRVKGGLSKVTGPQRRARFGKGGPWPTL